MSNIAHVKGVDMSGRIGVSSLSVAQWERAASRREASFLLRRSAVARWVCSGDTEVSVSEIWSVICCAKKSIVCLLYVQVVNVLLGQHQSSLVTSRTLRDIGRAVRVTSVPVRRKYAGVEWF